MKKIVLLLIILVFSGTSIFASYGREMQSARDDYFSHKLDSSLKKYKQISKDYGDKSAFLNATFIAWELANPNYAIDIITAALKIYPEYKEVLEFAGETYLASGNYFLAEKTFSTLVSLEPNTEIYLINLAQAQLGLGMKDMAEKNLKKATKGQEHLSLSNFLLGRLYFDEKDYKKSVKYLSRINKHDNQFIEAKKLYADSLLKSKKHKQAWDNYQTVASSERDLKDVKKAISKAGGKIEKDEKVIRYVNIKTHTNITRPISFKGRMPKVKVGIGSKINGSPVARKEIEFIPSHKYRILDTRSKKLLLSGNGKEKLKLKVSDRKVNILDANNKILASFTGSIIVEQNSDIKNSHTTIVKRVTIGHGTSWRHFKDMEYRGEMEFSYNIALNAIITINHVNIEEYVFGVLHAEMPPQFPQEALKAQAVLARTYAYKHLRKHRRWGYDLCDSQNCQVYGGVKKETEEGNAAVENTMGEILTYKGRPIEAVFSSNCGGFTQSSQDAGWFSHDYLKAKSDYKDFDVENIQPYQFKNLLLFSQNSYSQDTGIISPASYRWVRVISEKDLRQIVARRKNIGRIKSIIVLQRGSSGYVKKVKIVGDKGSLILDKEHRIKRYLAMGMLRSTYFFIQPNYKRNKVVSFTFYGGGWGHGVGLCQIGASGRAEEGQTYKDILEHYFQNIKFKDIREK